MAKKSVMGNNPLFIKHETTEKELFTPEEVQRIQEETTNLEPVITMSFKIKEATLKKLRDYAYTERISIKDALEVALSDFLKDKSDLLEAPEKPKQKRSKK